MKILQGTGVSNGIVSGKLHLLAPTIPTVQASTITDVVAERTRLTQAIETAIAELDTLCAETRANVGDAEAELFETHQLMLQDEDLLDACIFGIEQEHYNAAYAMQQGTAQIATLFSSMDDDYMRERAADVQDVGQRVIRILLGASDEMNIGTDPVILLAEDLAPSQTARLDCHKILGFVTQKGSTKSHTAIFARTMGIPAIVGLGAHFATLQAETEQTISIDGTTGEIYLSPDTDTLAILQQRKSAQSEQQTQLEQYRGKTTTNALGKPLQLCANIGSPNDIDAVLSHDAEGIGLFRSEFLYLGRNDFPTEEVQYEAYRTVLSAMPDKTVVVRTLDIGADKQADYFHLPTEENPALGLRAIRICLTRPDIFKTQLRALYRASVHGKLAIMFPMIASLEEIEQIHTICAEVRQSLQDDGIPFANTIQHGMMIETPAAAIMSAQFAAKVDFFSIGTNDLTQYTLAVDRQNANLQAFCDPHHFAVLSLIELTVQSAHREGIWVGVCGELAADPDMTKFFWEIGVDELSVAPNEILPLRGRVLDMQRKSEHSK